MADIEVERAALAEHFSGRRAAILEAWRICIKRDPALTTGDSLPRSALFDHIPALLATFVSELRAAPAGAAASARLAAQETAAAHGLQRWQQGYDLREVTRELGKLNECVVGELESYALANREASQGAIAAARRIWAALCSTGIEESVSQYFQLQQQEATGHVADLESALADSRYLEQQQGDLWQQAAHDLRGNLGVVANATVGLAHGGIRESTRDDFVRILMRNMTTLQHLLDDVTSLARLQAGGEQRHIKPIDVSSIVQQLCEGVRPMAQHRHLYLRCDGPPSFSADGDAVKIRRIVQNLVLNAVKFTRDGGITVSWGDGGADDPKRWQLSVADTGPGFHSSSGLPLAQALTDPAKSVEAAVVPLVSSASKTVPERVLTEESGEGIGLSIVKRLCELLDATVEMKSVAGVGTTFLILFPRHYAN